MAYRNVGLGADLPPCGIALPGTACLSDDGSAGTQGASSGNWYDQLQAAWGQPIAATGGATSGNTGKSAAASAQTFTQWLNANALTVALVAAGGVLLLMVAKR